MNQILATDPQQSRKNKKEKKVRTSAPSDIAKISKIFSVILIIFGIFMISTGSYALYKGETEKKNKAVAMVEPTISVERVQGDEDTVLLKTTSDIGINTVVYQWNDNKQTTLSGNGGKYLEQKIQIPSGSNILNISVVDLQNHESTYSKKYELDSKIKIAEASNGKISIKYEGETEISYMTYRWDDEEEQRIDINDYTISEEIESLGGMHRLTVIVVDVDNKTETNIQDVEGVFIPTINISLNEEQTSYIIKLVDSVELQEVVITLDEDESQKFGQKLSGKEFQFEIPLKEGDNKMKVEVTNSDDQTAEKMVKFHK